MKKTIPLVAVLLVLSFSLWGRAQGNLLLRIDHAEAALEIGSTESTQAAFCIALFSKQSGKFTYEYWQLDNELKVWDLRNLKNSLRQYLAVSNKGFSCIYPSDYYYPDEGLQVLGLRDTILVRDVCHADSDSFVSIKLSLDEAQEMLDAITMALSDVNVGPQGVPAPGILHMH